MLIGTDKQVLFRILKYSLEEFKDLESEEDSVLGYGKIFYDIRFVVYWHGCQ